MSHQLGPIDLDCDAPPFAVVRACQRLGIQSPEDVRWCRTSRIPDRRFGWREAWRQLCRLFTGNTSSPEKACICGGKLPNLERFTFTFLTGREASYLVGQCGRCMTVFWEEA